MSSLFPQPALGAPSTPSFSCDNRICFSLQWARGYTYRQLGECSVRSLGFLRMSHFFKNNKTSRHHLISAFWPGSCNLFCNCIPSSSADDTSPSQQGLADRQRNQAQDRQGLVQKIFSFQMGGNVWRLWRAAGERRAGRTGGPGCWPAVPRWALTNRPAARPPLSSLGLAQNPKNNN